MSNPDAVLSTERIFSASTREIFAAFEDPEVLARWWGPAGFTNTFERFEFRPEGRWVFTMHGPTGGNYANESVFRVVERDSRIELEHVVKPCYRLTVTLIPEGQGTRLRWDQEFENPEVAEKVRPLSETANEQNLDRLEAVFGLNRDGLA